MGILWRDVWLGSLLTTLLVMAVGYIFLYGLRTIEFSSSLDVASFIAVLMIGINYIAMIVVLGAVFCKAYAQTYGSLTSSEAETELQPTSEDFV